MSKDCLSQCENTKVLAKTESDLKKKRDIFRFKGEKDISINLEHVTNIFIEGKRITFQFYATSTFVDLDDDDAALKIYEQLLGLWASEV